MFFYQVERRAVSRFALWSSGFCRAVSRFDSVRLVGLNLDLDLIPAHDMPYDPRSCR